MEKINKLPLVEQIKRSKKSYKSVLPEELNEILEDLDSCNIKYNTTKLAYSIFVETPNCFYTTSLIGGEDRHINVGNICNLFYKQCKVHDLKDQYGYHEINRFGSPAIKWDYTTAFGYSYTDPYYARKDLVCWSYDINSAFAFAMLNKMPDTTKAPRYNDIINHNEIGFYTGGGATTKVGEYADIIFPLMESPFKEYIYNYYNKKETAKVKEERKKWKDFLNIPSGIVARKNIFIRNAIIYYSNEYIKKFIDDNTVYCNVDCIVSLMPRYDLPIGDEIGQFKEEHKCEHFKYIKARQYQWGTECHYSGIPSNAITNIEDTSNWTQNLMYVYKNNRLHKNKEILSEEKK